MKAIPVLSILLGNLLTARAAASGLFVEFNQELLAERQVSLFAEDDAVQANRSALLLSNQFVSDRDYYIAEHPEAPLPPEEVGEDVSTEGAGVVQTSPSSEGTGTEETSTTTEGTSVEETSATTEGTGVETFPSSQVELLAAQLRGRELSVSTTDTVACSNTDSTPSGPNVKVVVLISDCFVDDHPWIEAWVDNLDDEDSRYFANGAASKITYVKKYVNGCNNRLASSKVRFVPGENKPQNTVGVIAFVTGPSSYGDVSNYVSSQSIGNVIGFQNPTYEPSLYNGYNFYTSAASLNAYDPYSVVRKLHCKDLPGAVPTSYIDAANKRQCYCSCPKGSKLENNQCVAIPEATCYCAWDRQTAGFLFEIKAGEESKYKSSSGQCLIKNLAQTGTTGLLPVPVAVDNYVDHNRVNDKDAVSQTAPDFSAPHIEVQKKKSTVTVQKGTTSSIEQGDINGFTSYYTWQQFQTASTAKINAVEFTSVGKYSVNLKARDYSTNEATCEACVRVVDSRRPSINPSYTCPASVNDVTTELTTAKLALAQNAANQLALVKSNALNDPCSPNERCDVDTLQTKLFTQTAYGTAQSTLNGLSGFFGDSAVKSDLQSALQGSPFVTTTTSGISSAVQECTRCASASTTLKEWWTPYVCGSGSVTSSCDGTAKCELEQCVRVNGDTLAVASASLKTTVKSSSKIVVKNLKGEETTNDAALTAKYTLGTSVHVALACTEFPSSTTPLLLGEDENILVTPEVCSYSSPVSNLIDTSAVRAVTAPSGALFTDAEVSSYVSWRYRIDGGAWKTLSSAASETFNKVESVITVEAWTKCGQVDTFTFKVVLHLNNKVRVCDHFSSMWYQTTVAPLLSKPNEYCLFPKSDFAELTFDYHENIGIDYDVAKYQMTISRVACSLNYEGRASTSILDTDAFTAGSRTFQIVKQFAVDGVDVPNTKEKTKISVSCDFTYTRTVDTSTVLHTCPLDIVIKDCSQPLISKPCALDGVCDFNKCAQAGTDKPDLYQACDGNRITQASDGSTTLKTSPATCCPSCTSTYTPTCVAIEPFPNGASHKFDAIKRCEAVAPATPLLMAEVSDEIEVQGYRASSTAVLTGAAALVAVVALVAVQRRRAAVSERLTKDEAYYALLG